MSKVNVDEKVLRKMGEDAFLIRGAIVNHFSHMNCEMYDSFDEEQKAAIDDIETLALRVIKAILDSGGDSCAPFGDANYFEFKQVKNGVTVDIDLRTSDEIEN